MSLIQSRWINLHRLLLTSKKLLITRKICIQRLKKKENLKLFRLLDDKNSINNNQWLSIREDLCKNTSEVNDFNADCAIIDICWEAGQRDLAVNYVQYLLRTEKKKFNIGTIGRYFKLLSDLKRPLTPQEIEEVYQLYDEIMRKYSVVDALTAENLILGLSLTEKWKECMKLLDMVEETNSSRKTSYSVIISAAFNHDDFECGWKYLESMYPRLEPSYQVFQSYANYCTRVLKSTRELEYVIYKLFELWRKFDVTPTLETIMIFADILTSTGEWVVSQTTIKKSGKCQNCEEILQPLNIDEKEFKYLSNAVLNTLVGDDVYGKTTPAELRRFKEFVKFTKPYDVCIDGLNVAYVLNRTKKTSLGKELANTVAEFIKQKKKVFVLGRKHMNRWSPEDMEFIRKNCYIFFAHDLSYDDPFLLYATLTSGINTHFVSRDLMRQHKYLIKDDKINRIFRNWQMCRQIFPMYVGTNFHRTFLLIDPPKYLPTSQKNSAGWHIPYFTEESLKIPELNIPRAPKTWICLRKKS